MELVVFLHMEDISELEKDDCADSTITTLIKRALRLRHGAGASGPNVAIVCDEFEGGELLKHAQGHLPECVNKIEEAFLLAALRTPA